MKTRNIIYSDKTVEKCVYTLAEKLSARGDVKFIPVLDSNIPSEEGDLIIGETSRAESASVQTPLPLCYKLKSVGGKLVVKTGGAHSMSRLLASLAEVEGDIIENESECDAEGSYFDDPYSSARAEGTDLRIITANVLANVPTYFLEIDKIDISERAEIFEAALDYYDPDIVGVQEFCMNWHSEFQKYHGFDNWEILKFKNPNPQYASDYVYSSIMYRKDRLTLVDSGMKYYSRFNNARCRCMTWGIFRINETGREFGFVSTHWDGADTENTMAQVAEIAELANSLSKTRPVFTMGDLNSNERTKAFSSYLPMIDSVDCMHADESLRVNMGGSWHEWANGKASAGSCDHITATKKDTQVLRFETLMYNEQIYASDHAWLAVDIKLK